MCIPHFRSELGYFQAHCPRLLDWVAALGRAAGHHFLPHLTAGRPAVSSSGEMAVGSRERGCACPGRCHNAQVHTQPRPGAGSRKKQVDGTRLSDLLLDNVSADQLECVNQCPLPTAADQET